MCFVLDCSVVLGVTIADNLAEYIQDDITVDEPMDTNKYVPLQLIIKLFSPPKFYVKVFFYALQHMKSWRGGGAMQPPLILPDNSSLSTHYFLLTLFCAFFPSLHVSSLPCPYPQFFAALSPSLFSFFSSMTSVQPF